MRQWPREFNRGTMELPLRKEVASRGKKWHFGEHVAIVMGEAKVGFRLQLWLLDMADCRSVQIARLAKRSSLTVHFIEPPQQEFPKLNDIRPFLEAVSKRR
jgi:hypothetical protein